MNLRAVDLNLLVVFEALVSERQVTRAAQKVGLSQPAMSNALRRLRGLFKDEILVRTPAGMEPTPRALALIGPTQQLLRQIERVLESDAEFDPLRSEQAFRVRMGDLHGFLILPQVMARLEREAPRMSFNIVHLPPRVTVAALEGDELDIVISSGLQHAGSIRSQPLYRDRLVCVFRTGHPTARRPMTLENFLALSHLKVAQSPTDTRFVDDDLARRQLQRKIVLTVEHWLAAPHVVRRTDLVTVTWERMARGSNQDGALTITRLPFGPAQFGFRLYWHRRNDRHPAHQWLRRLVAEVCAELPSS
jgi:DNA-binding transcriptional LysR family regulator